MSQHKRSGHKWSGGTIYQGLKKLLFTVSPTLYLLMFIATCQGKFTHYSYLLD